MATEYNPQELEAKWQAWWRDSGAYKTPEAADADRAYVLDMFPYPSGDGLHVGHVKIYTGADVYARYLRHQGKTVLHPMGWDAFGLPTENSAIKYGVHPAELTKKNTDHFRQQMQMMGFSYDWDREINTTDPTYYKWTQWIFLQLFKRGLAYEDTVPINWCPSCQTGLANEEVVEGKCDRCGSVVELRPMRQWMLKITQYADRLLEGLDGLAWPKFIVEMQRNWIGRSEGVNFKQRVKGLDLAFEVYDSIPQTFMAQTFTMIAPDHPDLPRLVAGTKEEDAVLSFAAAVKQKKQTGKFDIETDMAGIFTGRYVENPFGTGDFPIWVSSFVLAEYGTGWVNASAHDERDFAFAKKHNIPLRVVLEPGDEKQANQVRNLNEFYREPDGLLQQPAEFAGLRWDEAREPVINYIISKGLGTRAVNYKLRDWVFSRQRYWGEPIPLVHCKVCGIVPVPEEDLPVTLPEVEHYAPTGTGESPLAAITDWVNTSCPTCGAPAKRETNTMPQWAGSSWYWLRFIDPRNSEQFADPEQLRKWLPVTTYVGGAEHAVLHLLYARFWSMVLFDAGLVPVEEPFAKLHNVGLVMGEDGQKMSKSRGNVINPDDEVAKYGADTVRVFSCFMGPFEGSAAWSTTGIVGSHRFVKRLFTLFMDTPHSQQPEDELTLALHQTITRVTVSYANFRFNTAVSTLMEFLNQVEQYPAVTPQVLEILAILVSPLAPHIAEQAWARLGHSDSVTNQPWPKADQAVLAAARVTVPVQVNGKVRGTLTLEPGQDEEAVTQAAKDQSNVQRHLAEKEIVKIVYIPDRLLNFVVRER